MTAVHGDEKPPRRPAATEAAFPGDHDPFYALIRNNPFGVYLVDADFRLRVVSQGARKVFATLDPLLGRDFADVLRVIWPEPFASEASARFRHTLATGEPYSAPSTVERRRDIGEVEAYDWRVERVTLPGGGYGVVCYFYDLSERQRWEAVLSQKEQELRSLTDNSPDILTRFDRGLRHLFVNAAVERATGRPPAEFLGRTNRDLGMPPDLCDLWDAALLRVFDDRGPGSVEFSFESLGGPRYFSARLVPETGACGEVESVLGIVHDVTDRKRAEAALRDSEERLRMALAAAEAGVWGWDVRTGLISWSQENYALYGLDPAAGPPTYAAWEGQLHPEDRGPTDAAIRDALGGRIPEYRAEFRVLHPGRGERWLLGIGRVEFGPGGEPVRMAGINLDITDRKRAELALAVQDRRKDEFLATLAHELRNPLAPIRNGIATLRLLARDAQAVQLLGMMDRQLGHLVDLVDDLLDVARVRTGKVTLRPERVTLGEVVDAAVEACRPTLDAKRHVLEAVPPAELVAVVGDRTRLVQVVSNLLTNAAKYTDPGGRIRVTVGREGGAGVVRVADDGSGIAPDVLPTLWDMFAQVRDTLNKAQGGLGIGLSLVKRLVEMHGGSVTAESGGLGQGSTFTVRLPLAVDGPGPPPQTRPSGVPAPAAPARRILVVDDNVDGAESLAMLLRFAGHEVTTAHSGPAGLAAVGASAPEAVFLDIGLPGMDGYEVARRIRAEQGETKLLLVALTGWGTDDDKQRSREAGFDHHLTKPVEAAAVAALLAGPRPGPGRTPESG